MALMTRTHEGALDHRPPGRPLEGDEEPAIRLRKSKSGGSYEHQWREVRVAPARPSVPHSATSKCCSRLACDAAECVRGWWVAEVIWGGLSILVSADH